MKQILIAAASAILLTLAGSCDRIKHIGNSDRFPVENVSAADSLTSADGHNAKVAIDIDVPKLNSVTADSIKAWILQSCKSICESAELPAPSSNKLNQEYADNFVKNISGNFAKQLSSPEWAPMGLSLTTSFTCDTVTDRFVTYMGDADLYLGGAHGSYLCFGRTIVLENARWLTWDIIPDAQDQAFLSLVLKELSSQYFETTPEEAVKNMFLPANKELPFPVTDPILTDKGLLVIYQQYEIAPYSSGLPQCVISYDRLKSFVTPQTAALFPATVEGN